MSADLRSRLGEGVNLPPDLIPDGNYSDDSDNILEDDVKDSKPFIELALAYYNDKHHTNYDKVVHIPEGRHGYHRALSVDHLVFSAMENTSVVCESSLVALKHFFVVLSESHNLAREIVSSCIIVDGLETVGCMLCDMCIKGPPYEMVVEMQREEREYMDQIARKYEKLLSQYAHCLINAVNWAEKDIKRLEVSLSALAYYNRKHRKDYKLVDVLPECPSFDGADVTHCNFIARQYDPANDLSNKLFFAELAYRS